MHRWKTPQVRLVLAILVAMLAFAIILLLIPGHPRWDVVAVLGLATTAVITLLVTLRVSLSPNPPDPQEPDPPQPVATPPPSPPCNNCEMGDTVQDGMLLPMNLPAKRKKG